MRGQCAATGPAVEAIGSGCSRRDAYERIINCVLQRYLTEDEAFIRRKARYHVPRFLLNDFARYWRTMAVDFAYKRRTRLGEGAALRNIKLRMSRKLIFVSGILTCFSCELGLSEAMGVQHCEQPEAAAICIDCLRRFLRQTPLEILAGTINHFQGIDDIARLLFESYDEFLGMLSDPDTRNRLEKLNAERQYRDQVFNRARELSHSFRNALLDLFFERNEQLANLTKLYGVF